MAGRIRAVTPKVKAVRGRLIVAVVLGTLLVALVNITPVAANHLGNFDDDPTKITASCFISDAPAGTPDDGAITLFQGANAEFKIGYLNGDRDASAAYPVEFTATISASTAFGAARTIDTQVRWGGAGLSEGGVKGVDVQAVNFVTGERVIVDVTSDATGSTVLASCDVLVTVIPVSQDVDGDGITNDIEMNGVRDGNGNLVERADHTAAADFKTLGANPCRKDMFVELDRMADANHDHLPSQAARDAAVAAFNNAPIPALVGGCPFAGYSAAAGMKLHIEVDGTLTESTAPWGCDQSGFDPARRPYFLYAMVVHTATAGGASGFSPCGDRGFVIIQVADVNFQAGTFLHELGHTLGLGHGGNSGVNLKPNYLSVMNYTFQGGIPLAAGGKGVDYSRQALPRLDEASLSEQDGIGGASNLQTIWWGPAPAYVYRAHSSNPSNASQPIDWNQVNGIETARVSVDVNSDGVCVGAGPNGVRDTTPAADDQIVGADIRNGDNRACDSVPTADDTGLDANTPCVVTGPANGLTTPRSGDDVLLGGGAGIGVGPNRVCNSTATGDDVQFAAVGRTEPLLYGFDDWANLNYRIGPFGGAGESLPPVAPHTDMTLQEYNEISNASQPNTAFDLDVSVSVDKPNAVPGDVVTQTSRVQNVGTGPASSVTLTRTLPNATQFVASVPDLAPGQFAARTDTYTVPFPIADRTTLAFAASASGTTATGGAEGVTNNNARSATTTVHTPILTFAKAVAPASAQPGDASVYTLTYSNTGSGEAKNVVVSDVLPVGLVYNRTLDTAAGPKPTTAVVNPNGTTTLTWNIATAAAETGPNTISYSARTGLLTGPGQLTNTASLRFSDANANVYAPLGATATVSVTPVVPTRNPEGMGFWKTHPEQWSADRLTRIQMTDSRFDGADGSAANGVLSTAEVAAVFAAPANAAAPLLRAQLLAAYFNIATKRIAGTTAIVSKTASSLSLRTVTDAVNYATATLALSASSNKTRYTNAAAALEEINLNNSERY